MPLSGYLSETALGWKMIFYVTSAIMFLTSALWYWFSASSPGEHSMMTEEEKNFIEMGLDTSTESRQRQATPWREIFRTPALWAIMVSHVGGSMVFILFFVDLPTYLERGMNISLRNSATLSALPFIGMWVGSIGSGIVCQKIYNKGWLPLGVCRKIFNSLALVGGGIGIICLAFLGPEHKNIVVGILVMVFFLFGFISAGFMVNHLDLSPQFAGVLLSLTNFAGGIGSILTPVVTSYILQNDPGGKSSNDFSRQIARLPLTKNTPSLSARLSLTKNHLPSPALSRSPGHLLRCPQLRIGHQPIIYSDISRWRIVFLLFASMGIGTNLIYVIFGSSERQAWDSPDFKDRRKADPEEMAPVLDKKVEKELEVDKQ
uniref:SFRICE_028052 n=1 Tax=Spodoptera frugiperda TaxID=7108 RepID=A0A2H1W184_SPOFR